MARPIKQRLDYFPFEVDFFSDEKIMTISGEFGIKGEITTIKLLCVIYRNGYFIEWSEMLKYKLLKELPGVSADLLDSIVARLVKWGFFDSSLFDSDGILTSRGIQKRYKAICSKMHRKHSLGPYCLLDDDGGDESPKPRRKTARPAPAPVAPSASPKPAAPDFIEIDDSVVQMKADRIWSESVMTRYKLPEAKFNSYLDSFAPYCLSMGKQGHENLVDAKRHFCNLLRTGALNNVSSSKPSDNESQRPSGLERHIAANDYRQRREDLVDFVANNIGKD